MNAVVLKFVFEGGGFFAAPMERYAAIEFIRNWTATGLKGVVALDASLTPGHACAVDMSKVAAVHTEELPRQDPLASSIRANSGLFA